jgi:hypothetical protein
MHQLRRGSETNSEARYRLRYSMLRTDSLFLQTGMNDTFLCTVSFAKLWLEGDLLLKSYKPGKCKPDNEVC